MSMLAYITTAKGDASVLQLVECPRPVPAANQLLVEVSASGINRADVLQRRGLYPPPAGESDILGLEIAGRVVSVGSQVDNFSPGDRVFGLVAGGGYAQYCLLDAALAVPTPNNWSDQFAAAIPEIFYTAHESLFELGQLKKDERVLIHAAGSGVGTTAVQMAKLIGANVFATTGCDKKVEKLQELGVDKAVNYKTTELEPTIQAWTEGLGLNVIEDFAGADYLAMHLRLLSPGGRLVLLAMMRGYETTIDLRLVLKKRLQIKGSVMRSADRKQKAAITERFKQHWLEPLKRGEIAPIIDTEFNYKNAAEAHQYLETNTTFGKLILSWSD